MDYVFEQPWYLLAASLLVFLILGTWRILFPEKKRRWQTILPLALVALAFGLDWVVATDREKVLQVTSRLVRSAADEDIQTLDTLIAPDYEDSYHLDRRRLLARIEQGLTHSPLQKVSQLSHTLERLKPPQANVRLALALVFEEESLVAQTYRNFVLVTLQLTLHRQPQGHYQITRFELEEVDKQPMSWGNIPGVF